MGLFQGFESVLFVVLAFAVGLDLTVLVCLLAWGVSRRQFVIGRGRDKGTLTRMAAIKVSKVAITAREIRRRSSVGHIGNSCICFVI